MGDLNELVERLRHRIANDTAVSPYSLMAEAAAALTSLIAERDGLEKEVEGLVSSRLRMKDRYRKAAIAAGDRALAAEAQLKEAREALEVAKEALAAADDRDQKARFRANSPRMDAEVIHLRITALRTIRALSLDTNKGDGV